MTLRIFSGVFKIPIVPKSSSPPKLRRDSVRQKKSISISVSFIDILVLAGS